MPSNQVHESDLTTTERLILETCGPAAPGEDFWTFDRGPAINRALRNLRDHGLLRFQSGRIEKTRMVWISDAGADLVSSEQYRSPLEEKVAELTRRNNDLLARVRAADEHVPSRPSATAHA